MYMPMRIGCDAVTWNGVDVSKSATWPALSVAARR